MERATKMTEKPMRKRKNSEKNATNQLNKWTIAGALSAIGHHSRVKLRLAAGREQATPTGGGGGA